MTRNLLALVALSVTTGCTDTLLDPASLVERTPDGRGGLFATGSEEEQRLAEELAYDYLTEHEERVLSGIAEVSTRRVQIREGLAHVRLDQELDGLPVFDAQAIVHLDGDGAVVDLTDGWEHGVDVDTTPDLLETDAVELAVLESGGWDGLSEFPEVRLGVRRDGEGDHLAYRVRIPRLDGTERTSIPVVYLDAHDGSFLGSYDDLQTATCSASTAYNGEISFPCDANGSGYELVSAADRAGTFTARNAYTTSSSSLYDVTSTSTRFSADPAAVDAYFGVVETLDYYRSAHGRNGIDGSGGPTYKDGVTTSIVHYGSRYDNAYWDGTRMVFGDGDGSWLGALTTLDIAGHELTHGVTQYTAGLVYQGESGALNESMSDVFGAMVEHRVQGAGGHVWDIGEDAWTPATAGDALRYMDDPRADGSSTDHYSTRYTGSQDNGGVHWNSGIANLAFYLVSEGGRHPRVASVIQVPALGEEKAGRIWYAALTEWMTATTTFAGARTATVDAAASLYGAGSPEVFAVEAAWAEVGVGAAPSGSTPTNPPPAGGDDALDLSGLSATQGGALTYTIEVPEGATDLVFRMTGGTGDADLYVKRGSAPTSSSYDCRPYKNGNEETCTFAAPQAGTWHVRIAAYSTFTGVNLQASFTAPASAPPGVTEIDQSNLSDGRGGEKRWTVDVPAGTPTLTVRMTGGTGDADLYLRAGSAPTTSTWDCRPYKDGNEETCTVNNPAAGQYHILVHAYAAYSGLRLTAN